MGSIADIFDSYGRKAQLFPGLLTSFPPLLAVLAWFPELITSSVGATLLTLASSCGLLYALSSFARTRGKAVENKLLKLWGGWPTTILLRHSSTIDPHTRARYHAFLDEHVPQVKIPTEDNENTDPKKADAAYNSAVKWLKEKTRGAAFPLVEKENTQYGFRRNLRGLRSTGLTACYLTLLASVTYMFSTSNTFLTSLSQGWLPAILNQFALVENTVAAALVVNLLAVLGWVTIVNDNWVKEAGFQYAERLLASCDTLANKKDSFSPARR